MIDFINSSVFFSVVLSLVTYEFGLVLKRKFKLAVFNPMLISIVLSIAVIQIFKIDYNKYKMGMQPLRYLLTPATVCLAIPLYEQFEKLKSNWVAILGGILAGSLTSMTLIFGCAFLFKLTRQEYITLLPKSITTAIGMVVSEQYGGIGAITAVAISITGISGNVLSELVLKLFRITEPVAKGIAIGTASHAMGTTKAMEIGEVEGAMSGLSIAVAGIITVLIASFFVNLY